MSLHELHTALEHHLEAAYNLGDDVAEDTGLFLLDNADKADWALRKVARIRRRLDDAVEVADAEMTRVREWLDAERARAHKDERFLLMMLESYHQRILAEDPKAKTVRLPAGELKARATLPNVEYVDADAFVTWARATRPDLLREKWEPAKADVKKALTFAVRHADDSDANERVVVDPGTGEQVPGLSWTEGGVSFTVAPDVEPRLTSPPVLELVK